MFEICVFLVHSLCFPVSFALKLNADALFGQHHYSLVYQIYELNKSACIFISLVNNSVSLSLAAIFLCLFWVLMKRKRKRKKMDT